ncbi:hypothetical protein [Aliivibrio fischeri]|uniref:hypothetical protein n=1 Tax=Aliivibrio fischeri TaxID=668 RepID=UPI0007C4C91B|nr:hypothetical protein [Aliivibrio fischeri]
MTTEIRSIQRTPTLINLIWSSLHPDMRGKFEDGTKNMVWPAPYCCLGSVENLPEKEFHYYLNNALRDKCNDIKNNKLIEICKKFNVLEHFQSTNQWRENKESLSTWISWSGEINEDEEKLQLFMAEVEKEGVLFPKPEPKDGSMLQHIHYGIIANVLYFENDSIIFDIQLTSKECLECLPIVLNELHQLCQQHGYTGYNESSSIVRKLDGTQESLEKILESITL